MQNRIIITIIALACVLAWSTAAFGQEPAARPGQYGGGNDHTAAIPSVPPPPGWKACPRCQNEKDRQQANIQYKVQGRRSNPRDLSGVWGYQGIGTTFRNPPPFTPAGKQRFDATIGERNAAGEALHSKDTSG